MKQTNDAKQHQPYASTSKEPSTMSTKDAYTKPATTTALKRPFENNSTTRKDIIKPSSDLKPTHFILPPLRFSHSSSFYHRGWCENRPFFPPCLANWPNHTKNPKNHTQTKARSTSLKSYRFSSNLWQQARDATLYQPSNSGTKRSND